MNPTPQLAAFLTSLGYDQDPECQHTAQKVTRFLQSWSPHTPAPSLEICDYQGNAPILLRDLRFYSLCAHHLLPFFGHADILHLPSGKIAGLGAFAHTLKHFCQRPQIQERLTEQVASHLHDALGGAILVRLKGRHLCMEMRGAENSPLVETIAVRGCEASELLGWLR